MMMTEMKETAARDLELYLFLSLRWLWFGKRNRGGKRRLHRKRKATWARKNSKLLHGTKHGCAASFGLYWVPFGGDEGDERERTASCRNGRSS